MALRDQVRNDQSNSIETAIAVNRGATAALRSAAVLTFGLAFAMNAPIAQATVITNGSISPGTLTTNPTTNSQIIVGIGSAGTLEVNSSAAGNGFTTVTGNFSGSTGIVAGFAAGGVGGILVNGGGSPGSATLTTPKAIIVGTSGGNGTLTVQNGGLAQATTNGAAIQAGNSNSTGGITVDGAGSALNAAGRIQVGAFTSSTGSLSVANGGAAQSGTAVGFSDGIVEIGTGDGATGTVTVAGAGSTLGTNGLIVGSSNVAGATTNSGALTVQNGGAVTANAGANLSAGGVFVGSKTGSDVTVTGLGSSLQVGVISSGFQAGKEVIIGGFGQGTVLVDQSASVNAAGANILVGGGLSGALTDPGTLAVRNGATVTANEIMIAQNGLVTGNGTITGDVTLNGGKLAPGNSPGTLNIIGDLSLLSGVLDLEIDQGISDLLSVTGDVFLGSGLTLNLIFGFTPAAGTLFDIEDFFTSFSSFAFDPAFDLASQLQVTGLSDTSFITVSLGRDSVSIGQPTTVVPEPATWALLAFGLIALGVMRRRQAAPVRTVTI